MQLFGNLGAFGGVAEKSENCSGDLRSLSGIFHICQNFPLRGRQYNVFLSENRHGDAFCMASHKNTRFSFETKDILGANSRKKLHI